MLVPFFISRSRGHVTAFLSTILPSPGRGVYCAVGIVDQTKKIKSQTFLPTHADVDAHCTALSDSGVGAFVALATFNDNTTRSQANAAYLRAFFIDLDCGAEKPYADQSAAAVALRTFLDATSLPDPTLVNSGGGLHAYWPLTEDVEAHVWQPYAKSLQRLCNDHGLAVDPQVTSDTARVLRYPGTFNYKQATPRPAQIIATGLPVTLEDFVKHLPAPAMDLSAAKQFGMDEATKDLAKGDYPSSSFTRIIRLSLKGEGEHGCAQMKHAVMQAATLEEPLWRAALSIAVKCEDGNKAIHTLSKGHPGYTPQETEKKAAQTAGPYTCEWYKLNYPSICGACKHKITSPISLGKVVPEAPVEDGHYVVQQPAQGATPAFTVAVPAYPWPYFRGANGGVFRKSMKDGEEVEEEIYRYDLYLTERYYDLDEHDHGEGELVGVNVHTSQDGIRRFYAPTTTLLTKEKMRDLLVKHGVAVFGKQLDTIMAYLASSIRQLQTQFTASKTRSQMGWTPDMLGFVVGELEYTAAGTKLAPPASGTRQLASSFRPKGTLEGWRDIANFYDRPGLEPHALALFFGFGSPLLRLIGGGFVKGAQVHLKHNGSGSGKSTAQMVVNSIFGHPVDLLMTQSDTFASKIHMLGMMNSIAYTVDEITNETAEVLSDYAYAFTQGRGRHRMDSQSNKLRANNTSWCNITITSGNASVVDALSSHKNTADGELRRVLELEFPTYTGATKQEIDAVFGRLAHHYGIAGPIYIAYVLQNLEAVREALITMQARIDKRLGLDQTDRFYSCTLACAFVGAAIAKKLGLLSIDINRVYLYAIGAVTQARVGNTAAVGDALVVAKETLGSFINENVNNALVINSSARTAGAVPEAWISYPRGALRLRYEPDTNELIISAQEFRAYFSKRQVDVKESLKRLAAAGIAKNNGESKTVRIGAGAVGGLSALGMRCYIFDGAVIGLDASAFQPPAPEAT